MQPNELTKEQPYIKRNITATRDAFGLDEDHDARRSPTTPTLDHGRRPPRRTSRRSTTCASTTRCPRRTRSRSTQEITPVLRVHRRRRRSLQDRRRDREADPRVGPRARPRAPARQLVDEPAPRVHARLRRGRGRGQRGATSTSRATCSTDIPPTGELGPARPEHTGVYFGEGLGGYSIVDTKVAEQEATARRAAPRPPRTRAGGREGVELPAQGRARAALRRLEPVRLGPGHERARASSTSATSCSGCKTIAPFLQVRLRPVPGRGRRSHPVGARRVHDHERLPVLAVDPPAGAAGQRARHRLQLRAQLGEGDGRRVRRHGPLLRGRPDRSDHQDVPQGVPGAVQDVDADAAGPARPHALPGGHLQRADRAVRAVPHHRSGAVLQQAGDLGHRAEPRHVERGAGRVARSRRQQRRPQHDARRRRAARSTRCISRWSYRRSRTEPRQEFLLERSFTPRLKGGILSAFVVARNPTATTTASSSCTRCPITSAPSPAQAATLIQSDQFISSQFTLLGQRGSQVIQGDVQLIPIGNAIMYVRPVWILGEGSSTVPALQVRRGRLRRAARCSASTSPTR